LPSIKVRIKEKIPAPNPLTSTISSGLRSEILRVKLLSNPQEMVAKRMSKTPGENPHCPPSKESPILASVMRMIDKVTLCPTASLNITAAINAVATPSKLSKTDAVEAGVMRSPDSKAIGARTPPKLIAPINQGRSFRVSLASVCCRGWRVFMRRRSKSAPTPLPKYRNAAKGIGSISPSKILESGVEQANRNAAAQAWAIGKERDFFLFIGTSVDKNSANSSRLRA